MSITIPRIRREPKPRKANRVETKLARTEEHLAAVQEDNAKLFKFRMQTDDHFMFLDQRIHELEDDVRRLTEQVAEEQGARAVAEADAEARGRWVKDLERQLADAQRKLDVRARADSVVTSTQEIDTREIRQRFEHGSPVRLGASPHAVTNPGRVPPSWAQPEEVATS